MPTQNVNLSAQQAKFIRRSVDKGGYRNASEVVRAGLRLLEQKEREERLKLEVLRRVADEAFAELDRDSSSAPRLDGNRAALPTSWNASASDE